MKKLLILSLLLCAFSSVLFAQENSYQLSSHILDITQGNPAANVKISLEKMDADQQWILIDEKYTDDNGRVKDFLKEEVGTDHHGIYQLSFYTESYFKKLNQASFYPFIKVVFEIKDAKHYHVPITVSPYGYSTYRGN